MTPRFFCITALALALAACKPTAPEQAKPDAAKPTAEWDARYGDPTRIVNRGYAALTRNRAR